ncbi:MAG: hypothetical protein HQM15_04960 [Deltaproteobacteria bacterium]|nr:hypothetical protein [Deltaproteobacteria bacterium]
MATNQNLPFKPVAFQKAKLAYLSFSDADSQNTNITLQKKPVFFENFNKINCSVCGTIHILGFEKSKQVLPASIHCALCQSLIPIEAFRERKTRRSSLEKKVRFQQEKRGICIANVVDFSPAGLRLSSRKRISPDGKIKVYCEDFNALGEAVWMRKLGTFMVPTYEIGIKFEEFLPLTRDVLLGQSV